MPPKSSRRGSQGDALRNATKKLCEHLNEAKEATDEIRWAKYQNTATDITNIGSRAPASIKTISGILKQYRKADKTVNAALVADIVFSLENDGNDLCGRIDPAIFSTVVRMIMQTEYCIESERGIYLLAVSLRIFNEVNQSWS